MKNICCILLFVSLTFLNVSHATTYYWVRATAGNWTTANSWSLTSAGAPLPATFPGALDIAVFNNGGSGTCTIAANATVTTFSMAATFTGTVQMNSGITLTVSSSMWIASGTFTQAAGIVMDNGTFDMPGGTYTGGSGTFTCIANFNKNGGAMTAPALMDLSGSFYIFYLSGSFNNNGGTVIMRGATPWLSPGFPLWNLVLQPTTTMTMTTANVDINNSLTLNGTGFIRINGANLYLWGPTLNLNNTSTGGGGTGSVTFIGGSNVTVTSTVPAGQCRLPNVTFQKSGNGFTIVNTMTVDGNMTNIANAVTTAYNSTSVIALTGAAPVITMRNTSNFADFRLCDVTIMSGCAAVLGERLYFRSLRIEVGGSLDVSASNYLLDMSGNWNNLNSTTTSFNERQGTVRMYSGTIYAAIAGGESFYDLILDDPVNSQSVITLNSRITIINSMASTFYSTFNVVYGSSSNFVVFLDNATVGPALWPYQTFAITGPVIKVGNDAFSFPCGDVVAGVVYPRPICMSAPVATNESFIAQYYHANSDPTYSHALRDPTLLTMSDCEYWAFGRIAGTSSVYVSLGWYAPLMGSCQVTTPPDLRVARWNGSMWVNEGQSATTGNATMGTVTSATVQSAISAYTLGSSTTANPLPIELISFAAQPVDHTVQLSWSTATETNNDYFTVERSQDGITVESIDTIDGAGNSTHELHYSVTDSHPYSGTSYYRLKQVDYNGQHTWSEWKMVEVPVTETLSLWPNPSNGTINLQLPGDETAEWTMTVSDITGNVVAKKSGQGPDMRVLSLDLPVGSYVLIMQSSSEIYCKQIVIAE